MNVQYDPNAYNLQAHQYAKFADKSFSWLHIEKPALDDALVDYYGRGDDIQVLDVGCGGGRVIKHLIKSGIPSGNITGMDPSVDMLAIAAQELPQDVGLVECTAAEMPFSNDSFNLAVANMVMHAMDSQEAEATIKRIGEVLAPGGDFFLIDNNPDPDSTKNIWKTRHSPWGSLLNVFDHDMDALLEEVAPKYGLECTDSHPLTIDGAGFHDNPKEYARYAAGNFRLAAMLHKPEAVIEA